MHKKSFTLVELIVSVAIIGLMLPTVFNIFFIMIRQQLVLISYQLMKQQGDSVQRNIKNILQTRAASITDSTNTNTDVCPPPTTPTPDYVPDLYIRDRSKNIIHYFPITRDGAGTVASYSADIISGANKTYYLSSKDISISNFSYTCSKVNEFSPPQVAVRFTINKSVSFKDVTLPYSFTVKLRNY